MDQSNRTTFLELAELLLDTEEGINEESYLKLLELGSLLGVDHLDKELGRKVKATDGMFYLKPKDAEETGPDFDPPDTTPCEPSSRESDRAAADWWDWKMREKGEPR
jgi:hypothetical protein